MLLRSSEGVFKNSEGRVPARLRDLKTLTLAPLELEGVMEIAGDDGLVLTGAVGFMV